MNAGNNDKNSSDSNGLNSDSLNAGDKNSDGGYETSKQAKDNSGAIRFRQVDITVRTVVQY